jgi:hypothetical protein
MRAETDSENRNTLTNPLTWRDRQMWVVAVRRAFRIYAKYSFFLRLGFTTIVAGMPKSPLPRV